MNISYSFLSVMEKCPFRATQKIELPLHLVAKGRIVHDAIESRNKHGGTVSGNLDFTLLDSVEFEPLAESTLRKYGASTPREHQENQIRICAQYMDNFDFGLWAKHEMFLSSEYKGQKVVGYIDAYDTESGTIYDVKTSQSANPDILQMAMYKWLLEANGYEVRRCTYIFPLLGKTLDVDPSTCQERLFRLMNEFVRYAESGHFPAFPADCDNCTVAKCPLFRR